MPAAANDKELLQILDAAWNDAARRAGPRLVCKPGCTQCCHGAFAINELDAQRLVAGMTELRERDAALAAEVTARARAWIDEHGATFPGNAMTGILGTSEEDAEQFEDYANEAACPALNPATGLCDVYEWRPMTCRIFGPPVRMGAGDSLGCCELCFIGASTAEIEACEMAVPHEAEQRLVDELPLRGETIVAFVLLRKT